jgi:hypothetical protein
MLQNRKLRIGVAIATIKTLLFNTQQALISYMLCAVRRLKTSIALFSNKTL